MWFRFRPVGGASELLLLQQVDLIGPEPNRTSQVKNEETMKKLLLFLLVVSSEGTFLNQTDQNQNQDQDKTPTLLQNRYLSLPMFLDSDLPLVHRDYFSPARGTGQEPLPDPVRQLLLPVRTDTDPAGLSGATVRTSCERNRMELQVDRRVLGLGEPVTHLSLGSCRVSRSTQDFLYFEHELHMCGTRRKVSPGPDWTGTRRRRSK